MFKYILFFGGVGVICLFLFVPPVKAWWADKQAKLKAEIARAEKRFED